MNLVRSVLMGFAWSGCMYRVLLRVCGAFVLVAVGLGVANAQTVFGVTLNERFVVPRCEVQQISYLPPEVCYVEFRPKPTKLNPGGMTRQLTVLFPVDDIPQGLSSNRLSVLLLGNQVAQLRTTMKERSTQAEVFGYLETQFGEPLEMQGRIWEAGEAADNGSVFARWEAEGFEVKFQGGPNYGAVCLSTLEFERAKAQLPREDKAGDLGLWCF